MSRIIYQLPMDEVLAKSKHLMKAIRAGQKQNENKVFILSGGCAKAKKETAGAITYGSMNPGFKLGLSDEIDDANMVEDVCVVKKIESELDIIRREIDELMNPFADKNMIREELASNQVKKDNDKGDSRRIELVSDLIEMESHGREDIQTMSVGHNIATAMSSPTDGDGYYLEGSASDLDAQELYNKICEYIKDNEWGRQIPLFIALDGMSEKLCRRLQFEYDAIVFDVEEPGMEYYTLVFSEALEEHGLTLSKQIQAEDVVCLLRCFRADDFCVNDFEKAIAIAEKRALKARRNELELADFDLFSEGYQDPELCLNQLIGLEKVKSKVIRMAQLSAFNMKRLGPAYKHNSYSIAFAGDPGTGKSEVAKQYASILAKYGITNGVYISAAKSDYVGSYVGWTAKLMKQLFERARGGVIFFDEAATFLTTDNFTSEALTELVRFMELYPDVVCVFASYEDNINKLLERDAGLRSRISEVIVFENYTNDELYDILELFCQKEAFKLQDSKKIFMEYADMVKKRYPDSFGNARFARNVFETAKEILAVETTKKQLNPADVNEITTDIIERALGELQKNMEKKSIQKFGFSIS